MGLVDLGHHGPAYTWTNKKQGKANIAERLDRALATVPWAMANCETAIFRIPRFQSDHLLILVRTKPLRKGKSREFKSENWWLLADGFQQVCQTTATNTCNENWQGVITRFKKEVNSWVKTMKTPSQLLTQIEEEMLEVNSRPQTPTTKWKETELERQHDKCLAMLERFWHQRSRVNMVLFGDRNSRFFHVSTVTRRRRNTIRTLMVREGE